LAIRQSRLGRDDLAVGRGLAGLGDLDAAMWRLGGAESVDRRTLAILEAREGPDHRYVASSLVSLGAVREATAR
jgi:hypothetical protein